MQFFQFFPGNYCSGQDKMRGPKGFNLPDHTEDYGKGNNFYLNFYQKWLSPVKGGNKCPMYPSCSQYAKIAFQKLPWFQAYCKSCERILRCGNELYLYPTIQINGSPRWYDPIIVPEATNENTTQTNNF